MNNVEDEKQKKAVQETAECLTFHQRFDKKKKILKLNIST